MSQDDPQELTGYDSEYSNVLRNSLVSIQFSIHDVNGLEFTEYHSDVIVDDYGMINLIVAQALERTLNIYINALPGADYDYDEISNIVEEDDVPYGQEYVSLLARQGKIDTYKEGKN